jgi:hypothetical protein
MSSLPWKERRTVDPEVYPAVDPVSPDRAMRYPDSLLILEICLDCQI